MKKKEEEEKKLTAKPRLLIKMWAALRALTHPLAHSHTHSFAHSASWQRQFTRHTRGFVQASHERDSRSNALR